jgi:20S proteasome subunit beta 1
MIKQPYAIGGSGSTYIYGYCDQNYKENMTKEECKKFIINGLSLAMGRDTYSGGYINLTIVEKDKVTHEIVEHPLTQLFKK